MLKLKVIEEITEAGKSLLIYPTCKADLDSADTVKLSTAVDFTYKV